MLQLPLRFFGSFYRRTHKKTVKKWKKYPCIPEWLQYKENDKFLYKLRSKEEIQRTEAISEVNLNIWQTISKYPGYDQRDSKHNLNSPERVFKLEVDVREFEFSDMQLDRFAYLVGPRLQGNMFKLVVKQFQTLEQNYRRAFELLDQLYMQARRAPMINYREDFDPYLRMRNKRKLGRTKQERDQKINAIREVLERRAHQYDTNGMTFQQQIRKEMLDKNLSYEEYVKMIEEGQAEEISLQELQDEIEERESGGIKRELGQKLKGIDIRDIQKDSIKQRYKTRSPWMLRDNFVQVDN